MTTYEPAAPAGDHLELPSFAQPVAIPIEGAATDPQGRLFAALFQGLLERMSAAAADRDLAQLDALVASCDRPDLPPAMAAQVRGFRSVSAGLHFLDHARRQTRLVVVGDNKVTPPLGQPIRLEVQVPAGSRQVVLGGRSDGDPIGFAVSIVVDDAFVDGGTRSSKTQDFVWLPERFELVGDKVLTLPIEVDLAAGAAVTRSVLVRVDLMPGYVACDGVRAPVQRTSIAAASLTQRPAGIESIAKDPLAALQKSLVRFAPEDFITVYLAASMCQGSGRPLAMRQLIEQVRYGRPDQSQVAMAALHAIAGVDIVVGDRDAWLQWWGNRRP